MSSRIRRLISRAIQIVAPSEPAKPTEALADVGQQIPPTALPGGAEEKYKSSAFEYVPDRLRYQRHSIDSKQDRDHWKRHDPYAKRLIVDRARLMFEGGISLVQSGVEGGESEPHDMNDAVMDRLNALRWRDMYSLSCEHEFTHGWHAMWILQKGEKLANATKPISGWSWDKPEEAEWIPENIDRLLPIDPLLVHNVELDRYGHPRLLELRYQIAGQDEPVEVEIHASRCQWHNTRGDGWSYSGVEILRPIWDSLIWLAWTCDSMGWHDSKHGPGVFYAKSGGLTADAEQRMDAEMRDVSKRRGIFIPGGANQGEIGWVGPGSQTDYNTHLEWHLNAVATATGAPKNWLRGDQQGSVTGSETDLKELFSHLRLLQDRWRPYLQQFIGWLFPDLKDYDIKFNLKFVMDEPTEAEVLAQKATAAMTAQSFSSLEDVYTLFWGPGKEPPDMEEVAGVEKIMLSMEEEQAGGQRDSSKASQNSPRDTLRDSAPRLYQLCTKHGVDGWAQLKPLLLSKYGSMKNACRQEHLSSKTWYCWDRRYLTL